MKRTRLAALILSILLLLNPIVTIAVTTNTVFTVMDSSDQGVIVGGGTSGITFIAPVIALLQALVGVMFVILVHLVIKESRHGSMLIRIAAPIVARLLSLMEIGLLAVQVSLDANEHLTNVPIALPLQVCLVGNVILITLGLATVTALRRRSKLAASQDGQGQPTKGA
ncbi:MAG TPA: hypothetical protein VNT53_04455 [Pseudolysinimonas sp.]|nr:hypothetical protein [Pseudolysinimonas sp.]